MPQTYQLVMKIGPNPGKVFPLVKAELVVGRDNNVDIVIPDAEVSRKHAEVTFDHNAQVYYITDLNSTNGVTVNSTTIQRRAEDAARTTSGVQAVKSYLVSDDKIIREVAGALGKIEHVYGVKFFSLAPNLRRTHPGSVKPTWVCSGCN